jgi:hypothetical protein
MFLGDSNRALHVDVPRMTGGRDQRHSLLQNGISFPSLTCTTKHGAFLVRHMHSYYDPSDHFHVWHAILMPSTPIKGHMLSSAWLDLALFIRIYSLENKEVVLPRVNSIGGHWTCNVGALKSLNLQNELTSHWTCILGACMVTNRSVWRVFTKTGHMKVLTNQPLTRGAIIFVKKTGVYFFQVCMRPWCFVTYGSHMSGWKNKLIN